MADVKPTEDVLKQLVAQNKGPASAINDYLNTGDIKHIDELTSSHDSFFSLDLARAALHEWFQTPASSAVLEAAIHRVATRSHLTTDVLPGMIATACVTVEGIQKKLDAKFVEKLRERGCDEFLIAFFWLQNSSAYSGVSFYWLEDKYVSDETQCESPEEYFVIPLGVSSKNAFEDVILGLSDKELLRLFRRDVSVQTDPAATTPLQAITSIFKREKSSPQSQTVSNREKPRSWRVGPLQALIARERPQVIRELIHSDGLFEGAIDWCYVVGATEEYDKHCIAACVASGDIMPLIVLDGLREGKYTDLVVEQCVQQPCDTSRFTLSYLAKRSPDLMVKKLSQCIATEGFLRMLIESKPRYCKIAAERWDAGGESVYRQFDYGYFFESKIKGSRRRCTALFAGAVPHAAQNKAIKDWLRKILLEGPDPHKDNYQFFWAWQCVACGAPSIIEPELWQLLQHKHMATRELAVSGLRHSSIHRAMATATELLRAKSADARLGAVELLTAIGSDEAVSVLQAAACQKHTAKVRSKILQSLEDFGHTKTLGAETAEKTLQEILAPIEGRKSVKLPKSASWLDIENLPQLPTKDGTKLSDKALIHLVTVQSKYKTIKPAPDNIELLSHIDREHSGDFALALLQQWLASDQNASDRWALTLAGLFGDQRILPMLTDPIKGWAEAARHKLAEYAAQAVALVPANESLMMLDSLSNRYRSRFRNIGKACRAALDEAAVLQGVTADELADMIVPTLGFDTDYQRALPDTQIKAVLQPDFKITFFNPETESETKTAPASLSVKSMEEIKTLRKLVRETMKGQTVRLEQSLVRQRAWPATRWKELFQANPFLRSFASRLVWSSLDKNGKCMHLFRRYPNGLLANAEGELLELDETDHAIVMAHPLNLDEQSLQAWSDHFSRMKVKPPFAQLARPVVRLEPDHGNRKAIQVTENHKMPSGTFRSRAEKLGWVRGSVGDGARVSSYYKNYPGAMISAFILIEFMYIGQSPADETTLKQSLFVKGDAGKSGNTVPEEPADGDDPRVIAFNDVPPVVYSETLADIQIIIA